MNNSFSFSLRSYFHLEFCSKFIFRLVYVIYFSIETFTKQSARQCNLLHYLNLDTERNITIILLPDIISYLNMGIQQLVQLWRRVLSTPQIHIHISEQLRKTICVRRQLWKTRKKKLSKAKRAFTHVKKRVTQNGRRA